MLDSLSYFRQMLRYTCIRTRLTILSKLSTRLASIHLCDTVHGRTRQCRPPQVLPALQWMYDGRAAREIVAHHSSSVFGEPQNSVVTAGLLGSSSRLKPPVAEEKGVRAVRRLIEDSIRLLMNNISTASLCRAVLPDAHRHSGGEILDPDLDTPQ